MMRRLLLLLLIAGPASASDTPRVQPTPPPENHASG